MHRGYIKAWRRIKDSPLWLSEKFTRGQAWMDLLLLANHKPGFIRKRGIKVEVKRGQVGWSEQRLAERWKWSRGKVRRFLSEMASETVQQITQQKSHIITLITITNYDQYQGGETETAQQTVQQTVQQTDTNKNEKNVKNKDCAEQKCSTPPFITLPLADKTEFPISESQITELASLYPAVDIKQQFRAMRGWLLANPKKRKTRRGVMRFANTWLAREQNKNHREIVSQKPKPERVYVK